MQEKEKKGEKHVYVPRFHRLPKKSTSLPTILNFVNAGLSGMCATLITHPMDVMKNRMQMSTKSVTIVHVVRSIYRKEGLFTFYAGLSAGLLRQATYTMTRLGIYNEMKDFYRGRSRDEKPSFNMLILMAAVAGSAGAFIGTPAEIALVRMTSDGKLPYGQRRNYRNVGDALIRIIREEGTFKLWRGSMATVGRAAIVNMSQITTYAQAKHLIATYYKMEDGYALHFYSSMVSGFVTTFNSMPFDMAKTRLQNIKSKEREPMVLCVISSIVKSEGIAALWKGFWPTYGRIGPHTVIIFMFNEYFAKLYSQLFTDDD